MKYIALILMIFQSFIVMADGDNKKPNEKTIELQDKWKKKSFISKGEPVVVFLRDSSDSNSALNLTLIPTVFPRCMPFIQFVFHPEPSWVDNEIDCTISTDNGLALERSCFGYGDSESYAFAYETRSKPEVLALLRAIKSDQELTLSIGSVGDKFVITKHSLKGSASIVNQIMEHCGF